MSVPDEDSLAQILIKAREADLVTSLWREPDMGNSLTAVALEPGTRAAKLCANLPLTLKEKVLVEASH